MRLSFDPEKRTKTLLERGLDFEDALLVFNGLTLEVEDTRKDYGETRMICFGLLERRRAVVGYTPLARSATYSACERQLTVSKPASRRISASDLAQVDAHKIKAHEYRDLPELTDAMLAVATVNKGGRPRSDNPRQLISLRLPSDVIERWRATGPGWQTRMAERLAKGPAPRAKSDA